MVSSGLNSYRCHLFVEVSTIFKAKNGDNRIDSSHHRSHRGIFPGKSQQQLPMDSICRIFLAAFGICQNHHYFIPGLCLKQENQWCQWHPEITTPAYPIFYRGDINIKGAGRGQFFFNFNHRRDFAICCGTQASLFSLFVPVHGSYFFSIYKNESR